MKKFILQVLTFATIAISCSNENSPQQENLERMPYLSLFASIEGKFGTRAITNETIGTDDEWSYVDFVPGDTMGFFSSGGKYTGGNYGEAPFVNQKLIYVGGTGEDNFRDPDNTQFSPSHMNGNQIYMYYPYSADITSEKGIVLRTMRSPTGEELDTARCIDFLSAIHLDIMGNGGSSAALYGEFQHTFAELIIMRGEGFDNPPNIEGINTWQIKVVVDTPVTGLQVELSEDGEPWSCTPTLVWDKTMEKQDAVTWEPWLGENFYKTVQDTIGQNAWYVIVPTIGCKANMGATRPGDRTIVEYIELYDNDGNLQRVSSLQLSNGNSKYVDGGWRYPMEISMKELVPTANPCGIVPWNGDVDLTDERKRGINNVTEFMGWVNAYNSYIKDKSEDNSNSLLQYGDLYVSSTDKDQKYWHFYILADLDLSQYSLPASPLVNELQDILDGQSTVFANGRFSNYQIAGLTSPLIGTLNGENAKVQNISFIKPDVFYSDDKYTSPTGIITNVMSGGATIENCIISIGSLYCPYAPAGLMVGKVEKGSVINCTLSGSLISKSTHDKIVGEVTEGSYKSENNNASNVTDQF